MIFGSLRANLSSVLALPLSLQERTVLMHMRTDMLSMRLHSGFGQFKQGFHQNTLPGCLCPSLGLLLCFYKHTVISFILLIHSVSPQQFFDYVYALNSLHIQSLDYHYTEKVKKQFKGRKKQGRTVPGLGTLRIT